MTRGEAEERAAAREVYAMGDGIPRVNGLDFSQDAAARRAGINPAGLPTSSAAQLISDQGWAPTSGYGYAGSSDGITGWQPGPSSVRAGDYGGSMERVARAQLGAGASQRDVNNYVGQLFELNGITNPRAIGGDMQIALPGANTPAATSGLGVYGKDIVLGEQMRANDRAQQMAASAQVATNASAGFADGRDARDMRLGNGYQSMMSRELSDLRPMPGSELRASTLSPRETAVDWVRSVVGTDRAGNVISGAVNAWLAGGEVLPNLPGAIAAIPSGISRLASGTGSAASQLWNDPAGSVTGAMASSVDGFRTSFNQTVNGNGSAMGSALFALGTMGAPSLRVAEGLPALTVDGLPIRYDIPKLYHYTNDAGMKGIIEAGELNPSLWRQGTKDVRYGEGQYLTDIEPGTLPPASIARALIGVPNKYKFTNYVEIDTVGLPVVVGRPGAFVVRGTTPLDLTGRILNSGSVP